MWLGRFKKLLEEINYKKSVTFASQKTSMTRGSHSRELLQRNYPMCPEFQFNFSRLRFVVQLFGTK